MSKTKILVTGASGMLGWALARNTPSEFEILPTSRSGPGHVRCELSDGAQVAKLFAEHRFDLVIHSAAFSDVDGCEADPAQAFAANAIAVKHVAQRCLEKNIPWIHVSTDYVFDGLSRRPYVETDPVGPVNIYGLSKLAGEFFAMKDARHCAVVRTSWLFGAPNPKNFVNAILQKLKTENSLSVLDDQTDAPTSVKDLSQALFKLSEKMLRLKKDDPTGVFKEIFHACNTGSATRHSMTVAMAQFLGSKKTVAVTDRTRIPNRLAVRPGYAVMNNDRLQRFLSMKFRRWEDSLKEFVLSGEVS